MIGSYETYAITNIYVVQPTKQIFSTFIYLKTTFHKGQNIQEKKTSTVFHTFLGGEI